MQKLYTFGLIMTGTFILFSFSTNPPDGYTGAPGDDFCIQCHNQTNPSQNGTISVEGFPEVITPHETYTLTAVNRLTTGTAVRGGFQVTILGPTNTKAGDFMNPSSKSIVSAQGGRQYWEHNPALEYPDSNVVKWTVQWTAPELAPGSRITWYAAGNIADGNFQNTGDRIVAANGSGTIVLSALEELKEDQLSVYPNPGNEEIYIELPDGSGLNGLIYFYDMSGQRVGQDKLISGRCVTSSISAGVYLLQIVESDKSHFVMWSKI